MTLIVMGRRRGGVNSAIALAYLANGGATVASNGIPLAPGMLTAAQINAGRGVLRVNGVEVQTYVEPLKGTHYDNTSCRSVLVQAAVSDVSSGTLTFHPDQTRSLSPRSKTSITNATVLTHARMLPSSAAYLCTTRVTAQPLLPASSDPAGAVTLYQTRFTDRLTTAVSGSPALDSTNVGAVQMPGATYDHVRALVAQFCRTGTTAMFTRALSRGYDRVRALIPDPGVSVNDALSIPQINTESWATGTVDCGQPEQHNIGWFGVAALYWLTGWDLARNAVAAHQQKHIRAITSQGIATTLNSWIRSDFGLRYNVNFMNVMVAGYLLDCNKAIRSFQSFAGDGRTVNYQTELPWLLDALETFKLTTSDGAYRAGFVGISGAATDPLTGKFPLFQASILLNFLQTYYCEVQQSASVLTYAQKAADVIIDNTKLLQSPNPNTGNPDFAFGTATYGAYYLCGPVADTYDATYDGALGRTPWALGMFTSGLGFVHAATGNGTYKTWQERVWDEVNNRPVTVLDWGWKHFGEMYGDQMSATFFHSGALPALPATIRSVATE